MNYPQLPCNRSLAPVYAPFERDGVTATRNYGGEPNYIRSILSPGVNSQANNQVRHLEQFAPTATLGLNEIPVDDEDFVQPRELWSRVFDDAERKLWVQNVTASLADVPAPLKEAAAAMFGRVDPRITDMIMRKLKENSHHL